jgi:uncharacterized DUF497 family protein
VTFEWDREKDSFNRKKHGISFDDAVTAFNDSARLIVPDFKHSSLENRFFCIGKVHGKIVTVRFTYRDERIRVFGAGCWREGRLLYEQENENP